MIKKWLISMLAIFNTAEGIIHIIVAAVSIWGIFATQTFDWRLWVAPLENLFFGIFSIFTGIILGSHAHHNHFDLGGHTNDKHGKHKE